MAEKKKQIPYPVSNLLPEAIEAINLKKSELIQADPNRGSISNAEAIARLILGDEKYSELTEKA